MAMNLKEKLSEKNGIIHQYGIFLKWLIVSTLLGVVIGAAGACFHLLLDKAAEVARETASLYAFSQLQDC